LPQTFFSGLAALAAMVAAHTCLLCKRGGVGTSPSSVEIGAALYQEDFMNWWDDKAGRLQDRVRLSELDMPVEDLYEEQAIKRAIVHTREDVVMVYSQLSSLNSQVRSAKWALVLIAILIGYAVLL
jgi:hypothetical protein